MPCHAMHPVQDLFLKSFSYVLQIDMHFICTPMWTKIFILVKSGCYNIEVMGFDPSTFLLQRIIKLVTQKLRIEIMSLSYHPLRLVDVSIHAIAEH
jgi:hypothetical protein